MCNDIQKRPGSALRWLLALFSVFYLGHAAANECLNLFPYDTVEDGPPRICQSAYNGMANNYSCQDYRSGENRYRVLYRGGNTPKAVLAIMADGSEQLMSSPTFGDPKLSCPLKSPTGVPKYATHRGTGVCSDENDQPIACSIYLHAAARQTEAHRYMVFYPNQLPDKPRIDIQAAGNNEDAMVAEIAFQLGMSLWETECCSTEAVHYFAIAYHLFPRAVAYRKAYQRGRALVAFKED